MSLIFIFLFLVLFLTITETIYKYFTLISLINIKTIQEMDEKFSTEAQLTLSDEPDFLNGQ